MGSQRAFLNVTDDQEHDNTEFFILTLWELRWVFYTRVKEIWLSLEMCHTQFSDISVLVPSNCFPPLFLSEGGRHLCNRFRVWGSSLRVLSPAPRSVSGFRVSSGAALKGVFKIQIIQFFPQKVTHKSWFLSNSWLSLSVINALGESEGKDTNL